jgi:hypothetical protein
LRQLDADADVRRVVIVDDERAGVAIEVDAVRLRETVEHVEAIARSGISRRGFGTCPRARLIHRQRARIDRRRLTQPELASLPIAARGSAVFARHTHAQVRERQSQHRDETRRNRRDDTSLDAANATLQTDRSNQHRIRVADRLHFELRRHQQLTFAEQMILGAKCQTVLRNLEAHSIDVFRHREIALDYDCEPAVFLVIAAANRCSEHDEREPCNATEPTARYAHCTRFDTTKKLQKRKP